MSDPLPVIPPHAPPNPPAKRVTLGTIRKLVAVGEKFPLLTCYDATMARWLARAGLPMLLVGDTAGEMVLGFDSTIHAPLDFMLHITAAVRRGAPNCFVMADMPFMSYQADDAEAIRNAGRFLTDGMADAVKLEVDGSFGDLVGKLSRAGIPVVAHIGSRPQQVRRTGGYHSVGRTPHDSAMLVDQAQLMEERGAVMLLLEATAAETAEAVVKNVSIPVIGCGAGPACHGHVVVLQDLLGLSDWHPPFVKPQAEIGKSVIEAAQKWTDLVRSGHYLRGDHPYTMKK